MEVESETYYSHTLSHSEKISIRLINPTIKDDRFSKHVMYTILGEDSKGAFEAQRRYKEFHALQSLLNLQWPGCFIPQIPEKKALVSPK